MMNTYAIQGIEGCAGQCEHEDIICHDADASADDLMLLPNAFLENLGRCPNRAEYRMIIADAWCEVMGCDEPDEYEYCAEHARRMLDSIDPDSDLP